jgi:hypothetical protein
LAEYKSAGQNILRQNPESPSRIGALTYFPHAGVTRPLRQILCASATLSRTVSQVAFLILMSWLIPVSSLAAAYSERPWWTERAAFVEGDTLFAVGVASRAKTVEEGRQQAFERGAAELTNYAQITSLEAQGLVIETQMTFEEPNADGTVNVYRLLRVPIAKLLSVQSQLRSQSRTKEQEIDKGRRELEVRRAALHHREQEAEALLQQLKSQLGEQQAKSSHGDPNAPVAERLREASIQVERRTEDTEAVIRSAQQRIARGNEERKTLCSLLIKGMTRFEVAALVGEPTARKNANMLVYGREKRITISFNEDTGEAQFIYGCEWNELGDERAKGWRQQVQKWEQEKKEYEASQNQERQKSMAPIDFSLPEYNETPQFRNER